MTKLRELLLKYWGAGVIWFMKNIPLPRRHRASIFLYPTK